MVFLCIKKPNGSSSFVKEMIRCSSAAPKVVHLVKFILWHWTNQGWQIGNISGAIVLLNIYCYYIFLLQIYTNFAFYLDTSIVKLHKANLIYFYYYSSILFNINSLFKIPHFNPFINFLKCMYIYFGNCVYLKKQNKY